VTDMIFKDILLCYLLVLLISAEKISEYKNIFPPPYNTTKVFLDIDVDYCKNIVVTLFSKSPFFGLTNGFPMVPPYQQCVRPSDPVVRSALKTRIECIFPVRLWFLYFAKKYPSMAQSSIFVDAGGNIGSCSLAMISYGVRTVAFEPVPTKLLYFQTSVTQNKLKPSSLRPQPFTDLLTLYPIGLGATKGTSMIHAESGSVGKEELNRSITIDVESLDEMLWPDATKDPPTIGVMKMDMQGFEGHALKGAKRLLSVNAIKIIQMKLDSDALKAAGTAILEVLTLLQDHGFSIHHFKAKVTKPTDLTRESLLDMNLVSQNSIRVVDLIAIHSSIWTL
jgi:FkbM family methyltransferase